MPGYEIPCYSFDILDPAFLFSFFGESGTTVSDWTHLSNRFRECEFSFSNCLLNSQLQRVDLGSTCACHSRQNSTAPHGANGRNNSQYCCANNVACFRGVQTDATTPNNTQQHETGCASGRNVKNPTMLRTIAQGLT